MSGLTKLTRLEFGGKISGVLPQGEDGLNALVSLETLRVVYDTMSAAAIADDKPMSGTLPDHLVGLTSLKIFDLTQTKISGAFPLGLAGAADLESIKLFALEYSSSKDKDGKEDGPQSVATVTVDINGPLPAAPFSSLTSCHLGGGLDKPAYISGMIKKYDTSTCSTSAKACTGTGFDAFRCCQDGGSGSFSADCTLGTDTDYCGVRYACPGGSEGVAQFPASGFSMCFGLKLSDPNVNYCLACSPGKYKFVAAATLPTKGKVRFGATILSFPFSVHWAPLRYLP